MKWFCEVDFNLIGFLYQAFSNHETLEQSFAATGIKKYINMPLCVVLVIFVFFLRNLMILNLFWWKIKTLMQAEFCLGYFLSEFILFYSPLLYPWTYEWTVLCNYLVLFTYPLSLDIWGCSIIQLFSSIHLYFIPGLMSEQYYATI